MTILERRILVQGDFSNRDMGNTVPSWYPDFNISDWHYDENTSYYYNTPSDDIYLQYGKNQQGWASARFWGQSVELLNEELLPNGTVRANVRVRANFFNGRRNDFAVAGFRVNYTVRVNGVIQYTFSGNTIDFFTNGAKAWETFTVDIPPETLSNRTALQINVSYPNGEYEDNEFYLGIGFYNPTKPSYKPMSIRKGNTWRTLNTSSGFIRIRKNGSWVNKSQENSGTINNINTGSNRIRKSGNWRQLPPM